MRQSWILNNMVNRDSVAFQEESHGQLGKKLSKVEKYRQNRFHSGLTPIFKNLNYRIHTAKISYEAILVVI